MYEAVLLDPAHSIERPLWVPGWVRADGGSGDARAVEGEATGVLRIDDLANINSVCSVQTSDLAQRCADASGSWARDPALSLVAARSRSKSGWTAVRMPAPECSRAPEVRAAIAALRSSASALCPQLTAAGPNGLTDKPTVGDKHQHHRPRFPRDARAAMRSTTRRQRLAATFTRTRSHDDSTRVISALRRLALILSDARERSRSACGGSCKLNRLSMPMIDGAL